MQGATHLRRGMTRGLTAVTLFILLGNVTAAQAQGSADKVALTVNGEKITEAEFYDRVEHLRPREILAAYTTGSLRGDTVGEVIMNSLIYERLLLQWAEKTKDIPSDSDIQMELDDLKKQPAVTQALRNKVVTEDSLKYEIKVRRTRFNVATTAASLSPSEVEAYYKAHITEYSTPERWGLAMLRTSKENLLPKIQAELKAGKSFTEAVKTYSEDERTKEQGGLLPVTSSNDTALPPKMREVIKQLKVGEVSPPLRIDITANQGQKKSTVWMFVRLISREPQQVRPFAEISKQVQERALLERAGGFQVADKKIAEYRKQAKIQIHLPAYQRLLTETPAS